MIDGPPCPEVVCATSSLADYGAAALSGVLAASNIGTGASIVANALLGEIDRYCQNII